MHQVLLAGHIVEIVVGLEELLHQSSFMERKYPSLVPCCKAACMPLSDHLQLGSIPACHIVELVVGLQQLL